MKTSHCNAGPEGSTHSSEAGVRPSLFGLLRDGNVSLLSIVLVVLAVLTFLPSLENDFINYDDPDLITGNAVVQSGLSARNVVYAFTHVVAYNWHPMTCLLHMADCQLFGLQPWGHHLINVLIHALNTLLAFLLFRKITGATWRSLFVAAIFGLHPLRVESVAWVAELKDVLSTLFWLLTLWAYAVFVDKSRQGLRSGKIWYGLSLFLFCLGLMTKPMLVTLPCVLLLMDYWPLNRLAHGSAWLLVAEKLPFFFLSFAESIITFFVQKNGGAMEHLSLGVRLENSAVAYCRYLEKLFWPQDLCLPYPAVDWPSGVVIGAAAVLGSVSVLVFLTRRSRPWLLVGWLWFLGTLVPVIGLVQVGSQSMADRYSYIPSLGILVFVTWGIWDLTKNWRSRSVYLGSLAVAMVFCCIALTRQQMTYWKNSDTLFEHAIRVTQNNSVACLQLADYLSAKEMSDQALKFYRESLAIAPGNVIALNNYGLLLQRLGSFNDAAAAFERGLAIKPADSQMHNNLGAAMAGGGHFDLALVQFKKAAQLDPSSASARANAGIALEKLGRDDQAVDQLEKALFLQPGSAFIHAKLAGALAHAGRFEEASDHYKEAIRLDPASSQELKLEPGYIKAESEMHRLSGLTGHHPEK